MELSRSPVTVSSSSCARQSSVARRASENSSAFVTLSSTTSLLALNRPRGIPAATETVTWAITSSATLLALLLLLRLRPDPRRFNVSHQQPAASSFSL